MRLSKVGVVFGELSLAEVVGVRRVPNNVIDRRRVESDICAKVRIEAEGCCALCSFGFYDF